MKLSKANTNGSVSIRIPKKVAEFLNWKQGDEIYIKISPDKEGIIIRKVSND